MAENSPRRAWPPREKAGLLAQAEGSMPEGLRKPPGKEPGGVHGG
jgi:hypothetical protein